MMTPRQWIEARDSRFLSDPALDDLIVEATSQIHSTSFGSQTNLAIALLVLHWLALGKRNSSGAAPSGQLSSEKVGNVARSYSGGFFSGTTQSSLDSYLSQTHWGMELSNLQQQKLPLFYVRKTWQ